MHDADGLIVDAVLDASRGLVRTEFVARLAVATKERRDQSRNKRKPKALSYDNAADLI